MFGPYISTQIGTFISTRSRAFVRQEIIRTFVSLRRLAACASGVCIVHTRIYDEVRSGGCTAGSTQQVVHVLGGAPLSHEEPDDHPAVRRMRSIRRSTQQPCNVVRQKKTEQYAARVLDILLYVERACKQYLIRDCPHDFRRYVSTHAGGGSSTSTSTNTTSTSTTNDQTRPDQTRLDRRGSGEHARY